MSAALILAVAATTCASAAIGDLAPTRRRSGRLRTVLLAIGRRLGAPPAARDLQARLDAAGAPLSLADAVALKAGAALAGALVALPPAELAPGRLGPLLPAAGAAAGFLALDGALLVRIRRRAHAMAVELPDVLDLLRVALQAGLPPTRAIDEVGRRHGGLLAAELRRAAARTAVGVPHVQALDQLRRRAPADGVAALTTVLARADRLGAPPAEALAALARDAREARARARAEAAARAAPKIQLIVALLLVPSVMLLVAAALVPALLRAT
jgi:tight adherence protein C